MSIQINPYLEFINAILLTGRYNEMTKPYIGYGLMTDEVNEYTNSVKSFLSKYRDDSINNFIEEMIPNGFTFSRPVELMLALSLTGDFQFRYLPSDLCCYYCGGMEKIRSLISRLKYFWIKTNFSNFYNTNKVYYRPFEERASAIESNYQFISLLEKQYGVKQNTYNLVISALMIGNFGISYPDTVCAGRDLFSVFATDNFSLSPAVILHEFSHPFINPLTVKHRLLVESYSEAYDRVAKFNLPGYKSGYGDWEECVNEHFVRAMAIHLTEKINLQDVSQELLTNDLKSGYIYIPSILEKYDYYDKNRELYKDFDSFYPELLTATYAGVC